MDEQLTLEDLKSIVEKLKACAVPKPEVYYLPMHPNAIANVKEVIGPDWKEILEAEGLKFAPTPGCFGGSCEIIESIMVDEGTNP